MSVQAMTWALEQSVVQDSGARFVLMGLANHADNTGRHAFPSIETLARYTGMTRRSVIRKITLLKQAGVLIEGNQAIAAAHIKRADHRPVVYDIVMIDSPIERGDTETPGEQRGDIGAGTGCHWGTDGVTLGQARGDTQSPEPSLNRPIEPSIEPIPPGGKPPAPNDIEGDLIPAQDPEPEEPPRPRCEIPDDMPGPKDPTAKTFKVWANYAMAYRKRYTAWPIWNAKNAGHCAQLIDRVGADLAPTLAAFYLRMGDAFYVRKLHPLNSLVADCESIATQMGTGRQMTSTQARQADQTQSNLNNVDEAKRLFREMEERRGRAANGS